VWCTAAASVLICASSLMAASARSLRLRGLSAAKLGNANRRTSAAAPAARTYASMGNLRFPPGGEDPNGPARSSRKHVEVVAEKCGGAARRYGEFSLHRVVAADRTFRAETPVIAQRFRPPHLGALRPILVPGPRIEIAERLVLHLIHLAEELDAHLVGVAMIDRNIVADDVPAGPPD